MPEPTKSTHEKKDRTFVRAVSGKYSELYKKLHGQPRVLHPKEWSKEGKLQYITPSLTELPLVTQAMEVYISDFAPGAQSQKHGHMNSALMYILDGKGYDVHDRERLDWQAGDALIIEDGCVHQHFNLDKNKPAQLLVIKAKPLFIFFNMIFQKTVKPASTPE
jgi:gentisate 1,2-dioxygenase